MRVWVLFLGLCLITSFAFAETYTGKAENIGTNDRGIAFTVVVKNEKNVEVLRRDQWVSTGVMTGVAAKEAVKNVVERMTQEMWAHLEGAKKAVQYKAELENYRASCDSFIEPENRPDPQDTRL